MPISLADFHGVPAAQFAATGALDPILGVDTRLFIDPALLRACSVPELVESYQRVGEYFSDVLKVVTLIGREGDRMWRQADKLLTFPEVAGLSIGYAKSGTNGSGMGPGVRARILKSVKEIADAGVVDPAIFELVGLFEDDVGPDRISDMIAKIIAPDLIKFTQRVCSDCGIPMAPHRLRGLGIEEDLPTEPNLGSPLILVPKQVLRDLPVALTFADVRWIAEHNEVLRQELNSLIASTWKQLTLSEQKEKLRRDFVRFPDVLAKVIQAYRDVVREEYNFESDPSGEVAWYRASKDISAAAPLALELPQEPTADQVLNVVRTICQHFRSLIEANQLGQLLYDQDGKPKHESAAQLLFFGIASAYCEANDLDLSPESDAGRGPVDFKVSRGFRGKVVVELKLTSNGKLLQGFEKQLPIYRESEGAMYGIYLVVDNGGAGQARIKAFRQKVADAGSPAPELVWVDAVRRPSASKA